MRLLAILVSGRIYRQLLAIDMRYRNNELITKLIKSKLKISKQ